MPGVWGHSISCICDHLATLYKSSCLSRVIIIPFHTAYSRVNSTCNLHAKDKLDVTSLVNGSGSKVRSSRSLGIAKGQRGILQRARSKEVCDEVSKLTSRSDTSCWRAETDTLWQKMSLSVMEGIFFFIKSLAYKKKKYKDCTLAEKPS